MKRLLVLALLPACAASTPKADSAPTVLSAGALAHDKALEAKAAAFVDAFSNSAPQLLKDGRVLFFSSRGAVPSMFVGDAKAPSAPPVKLETPDNRVAGASLLPDESGVLFISDDHSDGNFRIFRTGLDGKGLENLTPGETLHRDPPQLARNKPGTFAYGAHAASEQAIQVFIQDLSGASPRMIYRDEKGGGVIDLSPDGAHVLFERELSDDEQLLIEVDAASGNASQIFPTDGKTARIHDAGYSADGGALLIVVEEADHPSRLMAIDRASGKELARYEETIAKNGTIVGFRVSPAGDRLAIVIDFGNRTEVRLLDAKTLALALTVKTGPGYTGVGPFRADGLAIALTMASPEAPTDIFFVDVKTGAVTPLRDDPRPGLSELPKPKASIVELTSFDGLKVPLNLYLPADRAERSPVYVLIHGGPSGSAYLRWSPMTAFFASMGFAVVEPNIRGSSGFGLAYQQADDKDKRGDALKDVEAINRWVREQPWADPERIIIGGTSYGGYMTLLALSRQPKLWRAGINASGMSDLRTMEKLEDQTIRMYDETEFGILGKEDELLWKWSPLKYVDDIEAPLFVYQGVHDPISPQNEADQIVRAVRTRNIDVEYMLLENEGHGVTRRENQISYYARTYRFLADRLGLH